MSKKKSGASKVNADSVSLNKHISDTGFCSRRQADDYIAQGRVTINEEPALLGNRVYPEDVVEIDGEPIVKKVKTVYLAFHKPVGITSTTDKSDKDNIIRYIGYPQRIFPIGRLDKDSEGLIFLTNDGNIVNKILRAGNNHEKEYVVTVNKPYDKVFLEQMSQGVSVMGTRTKPCKVSSEGKSTFRITLTQGLNRQIRRMCTALGYEVTHLKRVRIMNVHVAGLAVGQWRYLTPEEVIMINKLVASSSKTEEASLPEKRVRTRPAPAPKEPAATKAPMKPAKKERTPSKSQSAPIPPKKTSYKSFRNKGGRK